MHYNDSKSSTSKTWSSGIKIFQNVSYKYHKLNNLQNMQISDN